MAVYTHSTPARYTHSGYARVVAKTNRTGRTRSSTFARKTADLRTRKRTESQYITREYLFVSPAASVKDVMPLGTTYDGTDGTDGVNITKVNRSPKSVGK